MHTAVVFYVTGKKQIIIKTNNKRQKTLGGFYGRISHCDGLWVTEDKPHSRPIPLLLKICVAPGKIGLCSVLSSYIWL